jgi:integrase/recombinase XerC
MNLLPITTEERANTLISTFLSSKGPATREAYGQDLKCFQSYLLSVHGIESIHNLLLFSPGELNFAVLGYRDHLVEKAFSPSTVNRRLGAVRSLFKLSRLIGFTSVQIEIPNIKSESYRDTKGPGLPAFKRMITKASGQSYEKAARDHAILRLLFDLALRATELIKLDLCHVEFEQKRISINGKGRTQREFLSLPATSIEALRRWIDIRGLGAGPLFSNLVRATDQRKRLTRTGLYKLIRWLGQQVNVKTRPHGVRHLSITEACKVAQNNGFALEEVMDHSRHKSIATLMIYRDRERDVQGAISTLVANTILEDAGGTK